MAMEPLTSTKEEWSLSPPLSLFLSFSHSLSLSFSLSLLFSLSPSLSLSCHPGSSTTLGRIPGASACEMDVITSWQNRQQGARLAMPTSRLCARHCAPPTTPKRCVRAYVCMLLSWFRYWDCDVCVDFIVVRSPPPPRPYPPPLQMDDLNKDLDALLTKQNEEVARKVGGGVGGVGGCCGSVFLRNIRTVQFFIFLRRTPAPGGGRSPRADADGSARHRRILGYNQIPPARVFCTKSILPTRRSMIITSHTPRSHLRGFPSSGRSLCFLRALRTIGASSLYVQEAVVSCRCRL